MVTKKKKTTTTTNINRQRLRFLLLCEQIRLLLRTYALFVVMGKWHVNETRRPSNVASLGVFTSDVPNIWEATLVKQSK